MRLRLFVASVIVIIGGLLIVPQFFQHNQTDGTQPKNFDMNAKSTLIEQDVKQTDRLCKKQCSLHFHKVLAKIQADPSKSKKILQDLQTEHPYMLYLQYQGPDQKEEIDSKMDATVWEEAASLIQQAEKALQQDARYESPTFRTNEKSYFVLGQIKYDTNSGKHQLIGVIENSLLDEVQIHQKRNFRVVPYPNENRTRMQTMDAKTKEKASPKNGEEQIGMSHYTIDEIVVKFNFQPSASQLEQIRKDIQAAVPEKQINQTYIFRSEKLSAEEMMEYFKQWDISYAEPHYLYLTNQWSQEERTLAPNDELFDHYQWNLPITATLEGWNLSKGSEDVIVAVIDTGVDMNHSDLQGRMTEGLNIISEGELPQDDVGHGTHVAGVISALVNNNEGVAGMSWYNKVMPIKVLDQTGAGTTYAVAQGIIWAVDQGASVINMSLGNYANAAFLHDAIKYAYERDVVLIAATGNDGISQPGYPAAYPEVLAVSAIDNDQTLASFSNYGDYVDVVAPGVNIASTYTNNRYASLSGTSMASPHVAALAAMIRSINPDLNNEQVIQIIRETAIDLGAKGKDSLYGYGQINVADALAMALGQQDQPNLYLNEKLSWHERMEKTIRRWFNIEV